MMKRALCVGAGTLALVGFSSGCSPAPSTDAVNGAIESAAGWTRPPVIQTVTPANSGLIVTGLAEPGARVVLRGTSGDAHAAVADKNGRFEVRVEARPGHIMLRPETQMGQDAASSPDRLLLIDGGRGPIVILRAGSASRRLDAAPSLGAVDSDGRQHVASGRVGKGDETVEVGVSQTKAVVRPDSTGFWTLKLPESGGSPVRVGNQSYAWSYRRADRDELTIERADEGWQVEWRGAAGARQSTWLPTLR